MTEAYADAAFRAAEPSGEDVERDYPVLLARLHERMPWLSQSDAIYAVSIILSVCPHCHAAPDDGCQCWNDE